MKIVLVGDVSLTDISKKLRSSYGEIPIEAPRDRDGDFEPQIVPKSKKSLHCLLKV